MRLGKKWKPIFVQVIDEEPNDDIDELISENNGNHNTFSDDSDSDNWVEENCLNMSLIRAIKNLSASHNKNHQANYFKKAVSKKSHFFINLCNWNVGWEWRDQGRRTKSIFWHLKSFKWRLI